MINNSEENITEFSDRPSFLCVHPSRELYGSDRTFLQTIRALRERWPNARITVLLTGDGPLLDLIEDMDVDVQIEPLFVLRRSDFGLSLILHLSHLMYRIWRARSLMAQHDVTYVNTVVLLDFLIAAHSKSSAAIVHVHELPTGVTRYVFSTLLRMTNASLIYISEATRSSYIGLNSKSSVVIPNGTAPKSYIPAPAASANRPLNVLLIGRFNAWKGQLTLLDAIAMLTRQERDGLRVRLVGSVFRGQDYFLDEITSRIQQRGLQHCVSIHPFDINPDGQYEWADVVAVPSTNPEPFGLVAIEAMAAGRAVVAAGHGGLAEIVIDGETGFHCRPADARALAEAIKHYLHDPTLAGRHGAAGRERFAKQFDEKLYLTRIADFISLFSVT